MSVRSRFAILLSILAVCAFATQCRKKSSESGAEVAATPPELLSLEESLPADEVDQEEGGTGARASGDEGKMGREEAEDVDRMGGIGNVPNPHMARSANMGMPDFGLSAASQMGHGYGTGDGVGFGRGAGVSSSSLSGRTGSAPQLTLGNATTSGRLSTEVVRRIVGQHRGRIRYCYEGALRGDSSIAGRVTVKFTIAGRGNVEGAEATGNTTNDRGLADCVTNVVKQMQFPEGNGSTAVTYPFEFQPAGTGGAAARRAGCVGPASTPLDCPDVDQFLIIETPDREAETAEGEPPPATQGTLRARNPEGEIAGDFPLQHTEVSTEISGYIAKTEVEQLYANPFEEVIEAVYVFPMARMGAVNDFVMEIGDRKIVGLIRPRAEAEQIYAEARARGQTASLLTQERPNIFTQSVANIEPGGQVKIRITYFEKLVYQSGYYEWVFPMVVGPRYIAGTPQAPAPSGGNDDPAPGTPTGGGGTAPATDRVPDGDRISPPTLRPEQRSGHDIGLTVTLDAGLPVSRLAVPTHEVQTLAITPGRRVIRLSQADSIPNRDFVLRWSVAGAETQFGVLAHRGDAGGFLTLMMQPPLEPTDEQVTPREITFIIDISGSMRGVPLGIAKAIVHETLDRIRPDDRFNVFYFSGGNGQLWPTAKAKTDENIQAARDFVDALCGGGGTEMMAGLRRAMEGDHDPAAIQMYIFLTDGLVGEDDAILELVKNDRGDARFFMFGIGSSVNRNLVEGIAENGGGIADVVGLPGPEEGCRAVNRLFAAIDSPVLVDVGVDWNDLPVSDVYPSRLPDLFAGQTINLVARYSGAASGTAFVTGRIGARRVRLPVSVVLPERSDANAALAPIWARWRIDDLSKEMLGAVESERADIERQITDLAVEFRLVSQYTAFVAVDESRIVGDGRPLRVMQPVEMPAGMSYEGVFGERGVGTAMRVESWGLTFQATESGKVRVGAVTLNSAAAEAGVEAGATLRTVNRTAVTDLVHLEGLLLQATGNVVLGFDPGGDVTLPAP